MRELIRSAHTRDVAAVFAVTASVQGVVVVSQFLVAFAIKPEQLGLIRWLESAFAIALLATSCGMPSVAFREAALRPSTANRISLMARAAVLTSLAVTLVLLVAVAADFTVEQVSSAPGWATLIVMTGALWPANVARVGVAIVQGGQLSKSVWGRLAAFSSVAIALLYLITWMLGVKGWVVGRYIVEFGLAALVVHALSHAGSKPEHSVAPGARDLRDLLWIGMTANFAFLIRAISDNLPILLLRRSTLGALEQLGWYGFASLAIFMPTLILSVVMQTRLPGLVQSVGDAPAFTRKLSDVQGQLLRGAALGSGLIFVLSMLVHWKLLFAAYAPAAWPLSILGASLPFRALILTAGAAAVAHGRYAISSVLAALEIVVVSVVSFSGHASNATDMALVVFVASALSVLPALALIRSLRRAPS